MQDSEKKLKGMKRSMLLSNKTRVSVLILMLAASFLTMSGAFMAASAHETGSPHQELPPYDTIWPYHALLVGTGLFFLLAGMLTARYMKRKSWWLKAHKNLGIIGALLTLSGVIVAVYMVWTYMETYLADELHAYVGIIALALVIITPIMGFMQFRVKDKRMRIIHRWSGRLAIMMMLINAALGLNMIWTF